MEGRLINSTKFMIKCGREDIGRKRYLDHLNTVTSKTNEVGCEKLLPLFKDECSSQSRLQIHRYTFSGLYLLKGCKNLLLE